MIRLVLAAILLVGCRISIEDAASGLEGRSCLANVTTQSCLDAESGNHSDLAWLQTNVFTGQCSLGGCHNGDSSRQGKIDLRPGMTHDHLVNYPSALAAPRSLVVPGDVNSSYLMLMLHDFSPADATPPGSPPPGDIGYMPMGNMPLCCQKMDAIERWIMAGAPAN